MTNSFEEKGRAASLEEIKAFQAEMGKRLQGGIGEASEIRDVAELSAIDVEQAAGASQADAIEDLEDALLEKREKDQKKTKPKESKVKGKKEAKRITQPATPIPVTPEAVVEKPQEVLVPAPVEAPEKPKDLGVRMDDLNVAIVYIRSFLKGAEMLKKSPGYNAEYYDDLTTALYSFERIKAYLSGSTEVQPTDEEIAEFKAFYKEGSESGWKIEVALEPEVSKEAKYEKEESKEVTKKTPEAISLKSDIIDAKLSTLGVTLEQLAVLPEFKNVADSEGKIISVLDRVEQMRLKKINEEARTNTEKHVREAGNIVGRVWRGIGFNRGRTLEKNRLEAAKKKFDIKAHEAELKGLLDIAGASPDVKVLRDEKTKAFKGLVNEYVVPEKGIDAGMAKRFNEIATKYSKIPPKQEWLKLSKEKKKEYENIEKEFNAVKKDFAGDKGKLVEIEFSIANARTFNAYPDATTELKRLVDAKGWQKQLGVLNSQIFNEGNVGFATGATAYGIKSAVAWTGAAVALPFTALALSGAFGYGRGWKKGKDRLVAEDEKMRIGEESDTRMGKKLNKLREQKASIAQKIISATTPKAKAKFQKQLEDVTAKIGKVHIESTVGSFVKSTDKKGEKKVGLRDKLEELTEKLSMDYDTYLKTLPAGAKAQERAEFMKEKDVLGERLQVRLEYTTEKLKDGKIVFGKGADGIAEQYNLMQAMAKAATAVMMNSEYSDKQYVTPLVHTRRSLLADRLSYAEKVLLEKQHQDKRDTAAISALVGVATAGLGYSVAQRVHEFVGSRGADEIYKLVQFLRGNGDYETAKQVTKVVQEQVKNNADYVNVKEYKKLFTIIKEPSAIATVPQDFKFDLHSTTEDLTRDFPKNPYSEDLKAMAQAPAPSSLAESIKKPFEYIIGGNKSRESAMIKYLIDEKGMSKAEAGKQAHLIMRDLFDKERGEEGIAKIRDGVTVVITEKDGKYILQEIPKGQHVPTKAPQIAETTEVSTEPEATPAPAATPKPDVAQEQQLPISETEKAPQPNLDPQPETVPRTGTVRPSPTPEQLSAIQPYEVKAPTNLPQVVNEIFLSDTRMKNLTDLQKDQVVYDVIVNHFLEKEHTSPGYLKSIGITSGDVFDIQGGILKLGEDGKDILGDSIQRVKAGAVTEEARGFRVSLGKIAASSLKGTVASDLNSSLILEELRKARQ